MATVVGAQLAVLSLSGNIGSNWKDITYSPDGLHASATWAGPLGANATGECPYGCDKCTQWCQSSEAWKPARPGAIGCCKDQQCCCCSTTAPGGAGCTPDQCISISKGKCPVNQCDAPPDAPTPPPGPMPPPGSVNQLTCTDDACTKGCKNNFITLGQCTGLRGTTQSAYGQCNDAGTLYTLSIFDGTGCQGKAVNTNPMPTKQCLKLSDVSGYLENICPDSPKPPSPPGPASRYHCDDASKQCSLAASGHSTMAKCQEACGKPPSPVQLMAQEQVVN